MSILLQQYKHGNMLRNELEFFRKIDFSLRSSQILEILGQNCSEKTSVPKIDEILGFNNQSITNL